MKSFPLRWALKKKELDLLLIILSWAWPQLENFLLYSTWKSIHHAASQKLHLNTHTHTHSARVVSLSPFCSSDYFCSHYWWFFFPLPTFWLETLTWLRICTLNSCVESQGESYVMWCVLESELKLIDNSMNTLLLGLTWLKVIMLTHW